MMFAVSFTLILISLFALSSNRNKLAAATNLNVAPKQRHKKAPNDNIYFEELDLTEEEEEWLEELGNNPEMADFYADFFDTMDKILSKTPPTGK